jgi:hypothetical protein
VDQGGRLERLAGRELPGEHPGQRSQLRVKLRQQLAPRLGLALGPLVIGLDHQAPHPQKIFRIFGPAVATFSDG